VLESHGLDVEAVASLRAGDKERFLARRCRLLDERLAAFFTERCGFDRATALQSRSWFAERTPQ
jgi:hypothetical protein